MGSGVGKKEGMNVGSELGVYDGLSVGMADGDGVRGMEGVWEGGTDGESERVDTMFTPHSTRSDESIYASPATKTNAYSAVCDISSSAH